MNMRDFPPANSLTCSTPLAAFAPKLALTAARGSQMLDTSFPHRPLAKGVRPRHSAPVKVQFDPEVLRGFCRARGIARLEVFGSALRDDFRPDSDVDLLATIRDDAHPTLFDWADMQEKLAEIFGRPVDLVSRWGIERSKNPFRKTAVLSTAVPIYVEG